jgi:hypothetical protein
MEKIKRDTSKIRAKASLKAEEKRHIAIARLKEIAVNCYTLTDALHEAKIPLPTFEGWAKKTPTLKKDITSLFKKNFAVRKQEISSNEYELTFTYTDTIGRPYNEQDKIKLVDMICYAYINGISITTICGELKLGPTTFFQWINPRNANTFPYAAEKYAESKETRQLMMDELLNHKATITLQDRLAPRTLTNTTLHYETRGAHGEKTVLKGKTVHERQVEPDMTAIAQVLNNLNPSFKKAILGAAGIDTTEFVDMTVEQLEQALIAEDARLKLLEKPQDGGDA